MHTFSPYSSALAKAALLAAMSSLASAQISYTGGTYSQNFDSLSNTATSGAPEAFTDNVTLPGWYAQAIDTGYGGSGSFTFSMSGTLNAQAEDYQASAGSSSSGDLYSFGATDSTERALGTVASGTPDDLFYGFRVQNDTGLPISRFTLSYDGEQWRRGGTNAVQRPETLLFFYRIGGTDFVGDTGWTEVSELEFTTPNATESSAAALDGNDPANRVAGISKEVILSTPLAPGQSLWLLWVDLDHSASDHGMAVDNLVFSATTNAGANVSIGSGLNFTPTSLGGNVFTADDTALFDGTPGTVTVSGNVTAAGLKFPLNGYTLTGGSGDELTVTGTVEVASGVSATISTALGGNKGLTKVGEGSLVLSGVNVFEGTVSINAGSLIIASDSNLGSPDNDITLAGSLVTTSSNLTLGSGRSLLGSGVITTAPGGTVSFAGPVSAGALAFDGPTTINFGGSSNSVASLTLPEPTTINSTGSALQVTSSLGLGQSSGATTILGALTFSPGDKTIPVPGGSLVLDGSVTYGGGRLVKTGAGTMDLTSATTSGSGGLRIGVVGSSPVSAGEGGLVLVDEASDLGTTQIHFNSGTLQTTAPIVSETGVSIGGRSATDRSSAISIPTFAGSDLTLNGASGFFYSGFAPGSDTDLSFNVNNTTRLNGSFTRTSGSQNWVVPGGSGTLVIGGDASALIDDFLVIDTLTLVIDGQMGGRVLRLSSGTTLSGSGTFTGWVTTTTSTDEPPVTTTTYSPESLATIEGTLAPSGVLTFNSGLTLQGATVLSINGSARGTSYDSVALINPATDGSVTYSLNYGGSLTLDFGSAAASGSYTLFETGPNLTRSGSFSSVSLVGAHSGALSRSGAVWTGGSDGVSFSFDESTGILTVTGGVSPTSPLEDWRQTYFGTTANIDDAADTADPDGDGISNLLEYATGTAPNVANASPVSIGKSGDGQFLTLSFERINDPSITYTIEASNDLGSGFVATGTTYTGTANDTVTYTDTVALATPGLRRFLRLVVSY